MSKEEKEYHGVIPSDQIKINHPLIETPVWVQTNSRIQLSNFLLARIKDLRAQIKNTKERELRIYITGELMAYQTILQLI